MRLTPHGRRQILLATLLAWLCCAGIAWAATAWTHWLGLAAVVPLVVWLWVLYFFSDPDRPCPDGEGLFISPADGCVADITLLGPDSPLGRAGMQIGVFMSVFDVHVNRMPCDGRVEKIDHKPGAFIDVRRPEAYERNESTTIRLTHTHRGVEYPVIVRQIAGLVARRIITDLEVGQSVARGQRFGMIKFGSRLELLLPKELAGEIRVTTGQKAQAGRTVLAAASKDKEPDNG